jgi:large subunit ribosomal protein L19e
MNLKSQKRIASKILKSGRSRIRVKSEKDVEEALTRNDVRDLVRKNLIRKKQKSGTSKFRSKKIREQKAKGRRRGEGRKKGTPNARKPSKAKWISTIRSIRRLLKEMKTSGQISSDDYKNLYRRSKGGFFRNKKHILTYMKEHEMIKKPRTPKKPKKPGKKPIKKPIKKKPTKKPVKKVKKPRKG